MVGLIEEQRGASEVEIFDLSSLFLERGPVTFPLLPLQIVHSCHFFASFAFLILEIFFFFLLYYFFWPRLPLTTPPQSSWITKKMTLPSVSLLCFMMWDEGPNLRENTEAASS